MNKQELFNGYDLKSIKDNPDFKEDSVREIIILPILKALGYNNKTIERSKSLKHPFLKTGSKRRPIKLIPDYLLKVESNYAWVLDAKAPKEKITNSDNVEQVYSYAMHPEIRSTYFALCNGVEFAVYRVTNTNKPILLFAIDEIEYYWEKLFNLLSPESFQLGKVIDYEKTLYYKKIKEEEDYLNRPQLKEIRVRKQAARRHFGCNAYFTRQSWDILNAYIKNFSKIGDLVLDSFAGSGVTAIEALMLDRRAIHIDINPLSTFMVDAVLAPVELNELESKFVEICDKFDKEKPKNEKQINSQIKKIKYPKGIPLPKNADVSTIEQLFTDKQIVELSLLKKLIRKVDNINIRKSLLLAFYNTLTIINKTFHDTPRGGGNHFGYYYRYRIAPKPSYKDTLEVFKRKFYRIYNGKKEVLTKVDEQSYQNLIVKKGSATDLSFLPNESVDYIYTDPPYGKKIQYLDLSIMWNAWLDLEVSEEDYKLEAIEGGEKQKSKDEYKQLIAKSIEEMFRVLKFNRWMSFVFAHKDPEFWHLIIDSAESCGFEYAGAIPQKNGQTSFKKRQNPFTVLSGQLIINFKKVKNPKTILKANLGMGIADIVMQTIEGIIAKDDGATLEQINDELIIKGLELGFLDLLKKEYSDLTPFLLENFDYDSDKEKYTIKHNACFKTQIDVKLRVKYYIISYLRRMALEGHEPHFDEIVLHILPLLKNGATPEDQTILSVLEDIAERTEDDGWVLKGEGGNKLF